MKRITKHVKMSDEFKKDVMEEMNRSIDKVLSRNNADITNEERKFIINRALDQLNIHISDKAKMKTLWVFDAEPDIPVRVDVLDKGMGRGLIGDTVDDRKYKMRHNLSWTLSKDNDDGVSSKEFEEIVRTMLKEDAETAAFYGALSFVTEGDYRE